MLRAFERTALLASAETAVLSFALTSRDLSTWQPGFGWALASFGNVWLLYLPTS